MNAPVVCRGEEVGAGSRFLCSAGILLGVVGVGKMLSAAGHARTLDTPDPLFGLQFRHLMLLVGALELLVAFSCLLTPKRAFGLTVVAWLATNVALYRAGLWFIGWDQPCGCMGTLIDLFRLSPRVADRIMVAVLVYMLVGSYVLLFLRWQRGRLSGFCTPGRPPFTGKAIVQR